MRRSRLLVGGSLGAASLSLACAQVLGVEAGSLTTDAGRGADGAVDGTVVQEPGAEAQAALEAASGMDSSIDAAEAASGVDSGIDTSDADSSVALDAPMDVLLPPSCDPRLVDAATGGFGGWYPVGAAIFPAGANVTGITPLTGAVALFAVDNAGAVLTTQASTPFGPGSWSPWTAVTSAPTPLAPGAPISAVARGLGRVDLFAVRGDGAIITLENGSSAGWTVVGSAPPHFDAQAVGVVVRDVTDLHLFAIAGGAVYETTSENGGAFSSWSVVGDGDGGVPISFAGGSAVVSVSRTPTVLDVFALGQDGVFRTSSRTFSPVDNGWSGWAPVGEHTFSSASTASPLVRIAVQYDLYAVDPNEQVEFIIHRYDGLPLSFLDGGWPADWWAVPPSVTALHGARVVARTTEQNVFLFVIDTTGAAMTTEYIDAINGFAPSWVPVSACGGVVPATSIEVVQGAGTAREAAIVDPNGRVYVADRGSWP